MEFILGIIGTMITIASLVYAVYSNKRFNKLENYNREQSWSIYRQASNVLAYFQQIDNLQLDNPQIIKLDAKGEIAAIELVVNTIKMIKQFEKKFDETMIAKWHEQGKLINDTHVKSFRSFI